jgi:hypothetical protein
MQALTDPNTRSVSLQVINGGGGIAHAAVVILVEGDQYVIGYVPPHGMLAPGRGVVLETPLTKQGEMMGRMVGVAICADRARNVHAWTAAGTGYRRWSPKALKKKPISNFDIFSALIPEVDLQSLEAVLPTGWADADVGRERRVG